MTVCAITLGPLSCLKMFQRILVNGEPALKEARVGPEVREASYGVKEGCIPFISITTRIKQQLLSLASSFKGQ